MYAQLLPPLPGRPAQADMAPPHRRSTLLHPIPDGAIEAAVLLLLTPTTTGHSIPALLDWEVLLIRRACYPGVHSGQIALPGGRKEPTDANLWQTACREAAEEVGICGDLEQLGALTSLYVPPSNFIVHPFVALDTTAGQAYRIDPHEVQDCRNIPLHTLDPAQAQWIDAAALPGAREAVPAWQYGDYTIWGATAMILAELYRIVTAGHLSVS